MESFNVFYNRLDNYLKRVDLYNTKETQNEGLLEKYHKVLDEYIQGFVSQDKNLIKKSFLIFNCKNRTFYLAKPCDLMIWEVLIKDLRVKKDWELTTAKLKRIIKNDIKKKRARGLKIL